MLCQHCKKNQATVNFIETVNGDNFELHLCEACYAYKYGEFEANAADAFLSGLFDEPKPVNKTCKVCGMSFSDYEKTGLLGCASCYDVFKEEIMPSILNIQGKAVHVGKEGGDYSSEHDLRLSLKQMQEEMEEALRRGDYAAAGKLNVRMQTIKKKLAGGAK